MLNKLKWLISAFLLIYGLCISVSVSALTLEEIRKTEPAFEGIDDASLAKYLHKKYAPDQPFSEFAKLISYEVPDISIHEVKTEDTLSKQSPTPKIGVTTQVETLKSTKYKDEFLEKNEFNLHEFLKKLVAHMFFKLLFAVGIFQLLTIGVRRIDISSAHQQGRWVASWLVVGIVFMTSLTKLDYGDYANFFGFFALQIVGAWLIGYVIGYAWFKLKAHPLQFKANNIACLGPAEVMNDFNIRAQNLSIRKNQKLIMFIASSVIALMLAYPPYQGRIQNPSATPRY